MRAEKKKRGRPSIFDRQEILEKVMNLFWDSGYKDLSFSEISQETGLTRASLYNAFQTKEKLFMEAFAYYFTQSPDHILHDLKDGDPIGPAFVSVFQDASNRFESDSKKRGCMGVNCINELMSGETELNQHVNNMYEEYKDFLNILMKRAIHQGELPQNTDSEVASHLILTFMNGFSVMSKSAASKERLNDIALLFLQNIGFKV
jgi:AcrR family transcriptional regulator